ncbi:MAG: SRPBCC domain-containing protein [Vicinamibacterales bacterium]|nr:SRPBCC domain-containing protein [Vicinamibacterales bacterium]
MSTWVHRLERTVTIGAPRAAVFASFTDAARWAAWWGAGSTIDARPGGRVYVRYPNGVEAAGEVIDVTPPERIAFTFGYVSGQPIGVGQSRVTIGLAVSGGATRLDLRHEFADAGVRDQHAQGWRFQLSILANLVCDALHADAESLADAWFELWGEGDAAARAAALERIAVQGVRFRDRYSLLDGQDDVLAHVEASRRFMPGVRLVRVGAVRHCQGTALADWVARGPDGQDRLRGVNVFQLGPDGRIEAVTGLS